MLGREKPPVSSGTTCKYCGKLTKKIWVKERKEGFVVICPYCDQIKV